MCIASMAACGGSSSSPAAGSHSSTAPQSPSPTASPTAQLSNNQLLNSVVLSAAQVSSAGRPVTVSVQDGGTKLKGEATLDECRGTFPSESARRARLQVDYWDVSVYVASNEVVQYAGNGAQRAYSEIRQAMAHCPQRFSVGSGAALIGDKTVPRDPSLVTDQVTGVGRLQQAGGNSLWTANVFQYKGSLFSGVYAYAATKPLALDLAKKLGAMAAQKLDAAGS